MAQLKSKNFVTELMRKLTVQIGATLLIEPDYEYIGLITFKNGKKIFYRDTRFSINPHGSVEISKDKTYSSFFLQKFGYNIPKGKAFFSPQLNERLDIKSTIDDGYLFAESLGFPVIIKPNNFSQGMFVTKIYGKADYYDIAAKIFKETNILIVENFYEGNDFRIVVFEGKIVAAYKTEHLKVIGNGVSTILELLKERQQYFKDLGRITDIDFNDYRIGLRLRKNNLEYDSVIPLNQSLQLLDNSNLSSGGVPHDCTKELHIDFANLAINITRDMELRLCGVDIITNDITKPISEYVINEINSAPGLEYYSGIGEEQYRNAENMYLQILLRLESE
jgi:D-alanine-D-alanine ligase-like ATP-grasp enzyme